MSLNWDATKVKDFKSLTETENSILNGLIWFLMFVGIGEITEKNAATFYARVAAYEALHGALLTEEGKPYPMKPKHIKRFIGLRANVSGVGAAKFASQQMKRAIEERVKEYDAAKNNG